MTVAAPAKQRTLDAVLDAHVRSGQTILVAGFGRGGVPFTLLEAMADRAESLRDLTLVKNDANEPDLGVGMLIKRGQVVRLISTHIGLNPDCVELMNRGAIKVEFVPQGIFAERLRAGGAGIPAFLTDIGIGTMVADGKPTVELDGRTLVVERALRGDVALLCADKVDAAGNCWWRGSNRNMSVVMGLAADTVIVEAREMVEIGTIPPEDVHLPSVVVDAIVAAQTPRHLMPGAGPAGIDRPRG